MFASGNASEKAHNGPNSDLALLVDFGSTYTKLTAVNMFDGSIRGKAQGPSTVTTNVMDGLELALADLERSVGDVDFSIKLGSSSAAGGLRMVVVGLIPSLTMKAGRMAALGAGARVERAFAFDLGPGDLRDIEKVDPDVILLTGGTDGGNRDVLVRNAAMLASSTLACPILVAGNRSVATTARDLLATAGKDVTATDNVLPDIETLNIDPARSALRTIFEQQITVAKGLNKAERYLDAVVMPTPAAVMEAAILVGEGVDDLAGKGALMVVDVGGATTDVVSVGEGLPQRDGLIRRGLPEPRVKRTVEADLGMRHSVDTLVSQAGIDNIADWAPGSVAKVKESVRLLSSTVGRLPGGSEDEGLDQALARAAVGLAFARHAGRVDTVFTPHGEVAVQVGKDLTGHRTVIGTGGVLCHGQGSALTIRDAVTDAASDPRRLLPTPTSIWVDRSYVLYAVGLLAQREPSVALRLANQSLTLARTETRRTRGCAQ